MIRLFKIANVRLLGVGRAKASTQGQPIGSIEEVEVGLFPA